MLFNRDYKKEEFEGMQGLITNYTEALAQGSRVYTVLFRIGKDKLVEILVNTQDNRLRAVYLRSDIEYKYYSEATGLVYLENITNEAGMLDTDLFIRYCGGWH